MDLPKVYAGSESYKGDSTNRSQPSNDAAATSKVAHKDVSHRDGLTIEIGDMEMSVTEEEELRSGNYSYQHKELSKDSISDILDMECGEPLTSQHLRIDFNPLEGVDDSEYLLNKCTSFWKLVEGSRTLQNLKALPEKMFVEDDSVGTTQSTEESLLLHGDLPTPRLGAIEVIKEKGKIVDDCILSKMKIRYCEEGSGDYFIDLPPPKTGVMTKWVTPQKSDWQKHPQAQREEVSKMCQELEQWDMNHPKSMEPPDHGPPHTYAVMQRN